MRPMGGGQGQRGARNTDMAKGCLQGRQCAVPYATAGWATWDVARRVWRTSAVPARRSPIIIKERVGEDSCSRFFFSGSSRL